MQSTEQGRILVIDDDEDLRQAFDSALSAHGYGVRTVEDAETALRLLERGEERPKVVLLDYSLPGINGAEFVSRLRAMPGDFGRIPIVFSSGESDLEQKVAHLPIQATLRKPVSLSDLLEAVDRVKRSFAAGETYLRRRSIDIASCHQFLARGELAEIEVLAHRMKGNGTTFGYPEISGLGADLESATRDQDASETGRLLAALDAWIKERIS